MRHRSLTPALLLGRIITLAVTCGTGGAAVDGGVELQGDVRERVRTLLAKKGFVVKG